MIWVGRYIRYHTSLYTHKSVINHPENIIASSHHNFQLLGVQLQYRLEYNPVYTIYIVVFWNGKDHLLYQHAFIPVLYIGFFFYFVVTFLY